MNIILIGMPGCGKSSAGVLLAKRLCKMFVDTDLYIQESEGMSLQQILNEKGLEYFLKSEETAILSLTMHNTVVATGGSVVYSDKAMEHLKTQGKVVFLDIPLRSISSRLRNIKTRGIANNGMTISEIYNERLPLYRKYADYTVDCKGKTVNETVNDIIKLFE